jgi:MFS family permease
MAVFAYAIELGARHALDDRSIGNAVAIGLWIGGPTALAVAWWSTRSGRMLPSAFGVLLTSGSIALFFVPNAIAYLGANLGFGVFFAVTLPYLLGVVSEMDNSGQMAAFGGFVNSVGLATGPAIAASLLGDGQYDRVVAFGVISLVMAALVIASPARLLDRRARRERVVW